MVVIFWSAAQIFWLECRRYVRTRRYWALMFSTLTLGWLGTIGLAALTHLPPEVASLILGSRYISEFTLGTLATLPLIVAMPLALRIYRDVYKTYVLPDLYLTSLHPLGIIVGRVGVVGALTALSLLLLTPAALWVCLLTGVPLMCWWVTLLLALSAYLFYAAVVAFWLHKESITPADVFWRWQHDSGEPMKALIWSMLFVLMIALHPFIDQAILPQGEHRLLPMWGFLTYAAPALVIGAFTEALLSPIALGLLSTLGFALWFALAAAHRRGWWSQSAYSVTRWGGTGFWLFVVGANTYMATQLLNVGIITVDRLLLTAICIATLCNHFFAIITGYYAPTPRSTPLPVPLLSYLFNGILRQWALQWLTVSVLYLAVGLGSGQWVAPEKWFLWSMYAWVSGVVLVQAIWSLLWLRSWRRLGRLEVDIMWTTLSIQLMEELVVSLLVLSSLLIVLGMCSSSSWPPLIDAIVDWMVRIHPWWGFCQEWTGAGGGWWYLLYSMGLVLPFLIILKKRIRQIHS